jgi:hypothetical protein
MRTIKNNMNQSGTVALIVVLAILAVAVMGTAMNAMFGETTIRQAASGYGPQAQYLAESGIRYAQGQIALDSSNRDTFNGNAYSLANTQSFTLTGQPLDLRVNGNYPAGATTITLRAASGAMPGSLALANTGILFYDSSGRNLLTQGRVSTTSARGTVITLESPGLTAALLDGSKVISKVAPYAVWSVGTAGTGGESASRVIGTAMNTQTEDWPPYIIIQGPGGTLPNETTNIFGIGNPDYGGILYKGVKLDSTNEVLDPRKNDGQVRLNIVARHGGDGWKAAIQVEGGTANMTSGNVTGQTWYQNDPNYWVPFVFTYNTTDGNTADGSYTVRWQLFPSYNQLNSQPDYSSPVVDMSHLIGPPSTGMDRVLGNWYIAAQAPTNPNQQFSGVCTVRNIKKNNFLLPTSYIQISSSSNQYTSLVSQDRVAETFIKITGEINLNWTGTPAQDYGVNLFFYIHDVPH